MLGEFNRLVIQNPDFRAVVLISADRGVLVHTRTQQPQKPSVSGVLVRGIRFPDQTFFCDFDSHDFPMAVLEQAWRCADDAFQVLTARQAPPVRLTWVYERAVLHCTRHEDGAILGVFVLRDLKEVDQPGVDQLLAEFRGLETTAV